jgi:hypothetical protein
VIAFVWLGMYLTLTSGLESYGWNVSDAMVQIMYYVGIALVYTTVVMCVVRGIPIVWESRHLLLARKYPWKIPD